MSTQPLQHGTDRRTQLAAEPLFAAERTYAAWVRTGLAALASGVGAKKRLPGPRGAERARQDLVRS
jgi:putative membrane protein